MPITHLNTRAMLEEEEEEVYVWSSGGYVVGKDPTPPPAQPVKTFGDEDAFTVNAPESTCPQMDSRNYTGGIGYACPQMDQRNYTAEQNGPAFANALLDPSKCFVPALHAGAVSANCSAKSKFAIEVSQRLSMAKPLKLEAKGAKESKPVISTDKYRLAKLIRQKESRRPSIISVASTTDTSVAESESQTGTSVVESPTDTDDASVQSADVFATQRSEISEVEDALAAERYWNVGAELNGAWQDGIAAWGGADGSGPAPEPAEEVVSNAKFEGDVSSALTEADASIAQPQEDVSIAQTEADASFAQPEEDVSIAQTEADASIAQPQEDVSIAQTEADASIAQPEEDVVSIAQPEEVVSIAQPEEVSIAQPEAGIEECGLAEGIAEEVTTRFSTRVRENCAIM
jgi:hypothetical protein